MKYYRPIRRNEDRRRFRGDLGLELPSRPIFEGSLNWKLRRSTIKNYSHLNGLLSQKN